MAVLLVPEKKRERMEMINGTWRLRIKSSCGDCWKDME